MSEIKSFSDYAGKYNTNVDYSFLFGSTQNLSTGSAINFRITQQLKMVVMENF